MLMSYGQPAEGRPPQDRAAGARTTPRKSLTGHAVPGHSGDSHNGAAAQGHCAPQPVPAQSVTPRNAPVGPKLGSLGVFVEKSNIKRGLAVTGVVPGGWSEMCGLAPGDTILSLNSSPAETAQDIKNALTDPTKSEITFVVCNAVGTNFRFNLPLPLMMPEYHVFGFLFEQDPQYGFHIITGVLKGGLAEAAGLQHGSCLRRVDGQNILGMRESEVRKRIIGGFGDYVLLSLQASGAMVLHDIYIPRDMSYQSKGEVEGDDDEYCDGWSEKIFSEEQAVGKVDKWMEVNPTTVGGWDDSIENFYSSYENGEAAEEPAPPASYSAAPPNAPPPARISPPPPSLTPPPVPSIPRLQQDMDENNSPQVDGEGSVDVVKPKLHPQRSQAPAQRRQEPPPGASEDNRAANLSSKELRYLDERLEAAKQEILMQLQESHAGGFENFDEQTAAVRGVLSSALGALRNDREERERLRKRRSQLEKRIMELEQTIIVLKGS